MWRIVALLFAISFVIPLQVLAWGVNTHFGVTKTAAVGADNFQNFLKTFGLDPLPKEDCEVDAHPSESENQGYDIYVDPKDPAKKPKNQGFLELANYLSYDGKKEFTFGPIINGCTAVNVVAAGAILEDSNPCGIMGGDQTIDNICRSLRHFFDPHNNDGMLGKSNARDWAIEGDVDSNLGGTKENLNVFKWGDDHDPDTNGDNDLSLFDHFRDTVIGSTPEKRVIGGQRLFVTLGHVSHLLEDMFQPAHVRDDEHGDKLGLDTEVEYLEETVQEHVAYEGYGKEELYARVSDEYLNSGKIPEVSTISDLFTEAATFTNANFFSTDTIFDDYDHTSHSFSGYDSPNEDNTDYREEPVRFVLESGKVVEADNRKFIVSTSKDVNEIANTNSKTQSSYGSTKPRLAMEKAGLEKNDKKNCGPYKFDAEAEVVTSHPSYCTMDQELVVLDNAMALLPKAVAYPKALINHFFRGEIEAVLISDGVMRIRNTSNYDLNGFVDGDKKFQLHCESKDGNMTECTDLIIETIILNDPQQFNSLEEADKAVIDVLNNPQPIIDFSVPKDTTNLAHLKVDEFIYVSLQQTSDHKRIVVFYDGKIGAERGVAATVVKQQFTSEEQTLQFVYPIEGLPGDTDCPAASGTPKRVDGNPSSWYSVVWNGTYTDGCKGTGGHPGVDIRVDSGTPVHAIGSGTVHKSYDSPTWGGLIVIKHTLPTETVWSVYAHLKQRNVTKGTVTVGQVIGLSGGSTTDPNHGNSTGPHLHFQIDKGNVFLYPYWPSSGVGTVDSKIEANTYDPIKFIKDHSTGSSNPGNETPPDTSTNCSGEACNGLNPETTTCSDSASTVGGPKDIYATLNGTSQKVGTVELRWSSTCKTNWSRVIRNDGATGESVMAKIVRDDDVQYFKELPLAPESEWTDGLTRIWSPMVYAPADCSAYAQGMIDFSFVSSEFVIANQDGCSGNETPTPEPPPSCTPSVNSVSPLTVTLDETTTFTVYGSCLPDTTAFWIGECADLVALGGNDQERRFSCTPSYTAGIKDGVVKDQSGGTVLLDFNVNVQAPYTPPPPPPEVCTPSVNSVSPLTVTLDETTTFTVYGSCLPDTTAFWIGECANLVALGGSEQERRFSCTPSYTAGIKDGVVKDQPNGNLLHSFTVNVQAPYIDPPPCTPSVNSVSPLTVTLDETTTFTVSGSCLPDTTAFWIGECANLVALGGSEQERRFSCTPSYTAGIKDGVVKDQSGGTVLLDFNVNVQQAQSSSTGSCSVGQVENCNGGCTNESWIGDDYCDAELNCSTFNNDGGDCASQSSSTSSCSVGQVEDCNGSCSNESWIGDNYCDAEFNCSTFSNDGGDCSSQSLPACGADQVADCNGGCTNESWIGDNYCDAEFNCSAFSNDGGDCNTSSTSTSSTPIAGASCGAGSVYDCSLQCKDEADIQSWIGDTYCDDGAYGVVLTCPAFDNDGGDCESSSSSTCSPYVNSVSPLSVTFEQTTTFTVQGGCLPDSTAFWIGECANMVSQGGNSQTRYFTCTPSYSTGIKDGVVKDQSGGTVLLDFTVDVHW